ncbi:fungal-specific transcription factor domain-containing protein [Calycina marina]|uniref:Fungal-specific transcription factor domain-containing protein n=1 Tax=Calycina marina TaxID=1763456 RepID=A0A9P8CAK0_9HELO|nr:fungal-specific transcription factor domain-containing protein [Calycina marina]
MLIDVQPDALTCFHCSQTFSRPSHLNRHRQTHIPRLRRLTVSCTQCHRTFLRKDILLRHLRVAHRINTANPRSTRKSCFRCVQRKLKCDRAQICHSCAVANATCLYAPTHEAPREHNDGSADTSVVEQSPESSTLSDTGPFNFTTAPNLVAPTTRITHEGSGLCHPIANEEQLSNAVADYNPLDVYSLSPATQEMAPTLFNMDSYNSIVPDGGGYLNGDDSGHTALVVSPTYQLDFRASAFDWVDFNVPNMMIPDANSFTTLGLSGCLPNIDLPALVQPWPFDDQAQEVKPSQHKLPPLRLVLQGAFDSHDNSRDALPSGFLSLFSDPWLPPQDTLDHASFLPAVYLLRRLVDTYFTKFHPIQPVTHMPTWTMASCPTVLLAAMACIGAMLSDDENYAKLSESLSGLCSSIITWLGASDSMSYRDISYLDSLCLHQIYSLGSGSRQLYQNADRSRGALIGSLRGLGLLKSGLRMGADVAEFMLIPGGYSTTHSEWIVWVDAERERRTTWAAFEYDCSLCTLTSRRASVDVSELPRRLPCHDAVWEAPTAAAWAALRSRLGRNGLGNLYSSVLAAVLATEPVPEHTSPWGKRLCAQIIGRMLWDLKQLEVISARDYFSLPSLSAAQQKPKKSLLLALDNLVKSMDRPASTSELISYNVASLLCHYSHLSAAPDVLDYTLFIARSVASQASLPDRGIDVAQRRLRSAFAKNPVEARRLVSHAAQIVAVCNEYLVSAPCEILRLFMGYVFIIAFAKYFPRNSDYSVDHSLSYPRLDVSLYQHAQKAAVANWIAWGGPASVGSVEDIFSDGAVVAISQEAQSMLQRLRFWGLADKFIMILQSFESHGA